MSEIILISSLRPVEAHGFQLSFSNKHGYIQISKDGRKCTHFYVNRTPITSDEVYISVMEEVLKDFIKTAKVGSGSKKDYVEAYGSGETKEDIDFMWDSYKTANKKLRKLLGCDPLVFIQHFLF